MDTQRATEIQAVLEGIPLPATREALVAYARAQDASIAEELSLLPDRTYDRLDLVGEMLTNGAAEPVTPPPPLPHAESGEPPGGADYLTPSPDDTGAVPDDAPPGNPPQKTIRRESRAQARQKKVQQGG